MSFSESIDDVVAANQNRLLSGHKTWERVQLRDIVAVLNGFAFPSAGFSKSEGTPLIRIRDVLRGETETLFAGEYEDSYLVRRGELVVGMDGDFNSGLWAGRTALLNQRVCKLTPNERFFDRSFLAYVLPGYLAAINAHTSAITVKHLSSRTVEKIPLPLPPLDEQRRIVAKLDELFSRLDAGVAALEAARAKLKRLRASVLKSAIEGRLTADWREANPDVEPASELLTRLLAQRRTRQIEAKLAKWRARKEKAGWTADKIAAAEPKQRDQLAAKYEEPKPPETDDLPELPATWCYATIDGVLSEPMRNGHSAKESRDGTGVRTLTLTAVTVGDFSVENTKLTTANPSDVVDLWLKNGDIFIERSNTPELVGTAAIYLGPGDYAIFPDLLVRVRVSQSLSTHYLISVLSSDRSRRFYRKRAKGIAGSMPKIDQSTIAALPIPFPPIREQAEIVRHVDEHLSRIDAAEKAIDAGLARAKRLRQAILKRAFEGKLVPQDPTDEPASVLLECIRAEREAADADAARDKGYGSGKTRRKKKAPKKVAAKPVSADSAIRNPPSAIPDKQLSLIGDEPEATASIDPAAIAEAFRQSHDGWSTDYVVVSTEANARFLDAASRLGIDTPAVAVNKFLLNIRKTLTAELPKATRRHRVEKGLAPFEFVSEWSIRIVQRQLKKELGREPSLDTIFCDPELAKRFDDAAARLKNVFSPLDYRWTALKLRKLKRGKASDLIEFGEPLGLEEAAHAADETPGAYRVLAASEPLFVGHTKNLREQLLRHAVTSGDASEVVPSWAASDLRGEQAIEFVTTIASPAAVASAVRDATRPSLNVAAVQRTW